MEWDTRSASAALCRTGLDAADRTVTRDALQLSPDVELDPVSTPCPPPFVFLPPCLRYPSSFFLPSCAIARVAGVAVAARCVNDNVAKDDIPKLFPEEVPPELQKLLTLLLQKFQPEWQHHAAKDQVRIYCVRAGFPGIGAHRTRGGLLVKFAWGKGKLSAQTAFVESLAE
ncbi:hypothetical protein BDA96_06G200600 [Sorghum bicolor]|uniref:Uncharacterized protein n=1 Tax=Sorghum bicolor TaxID=4558 RepID=A0A921QSJ5_SORBI|nr:hypothetical protein BDA96_06G200600 [Sorghum bicolor]